MASRGLKHSGGTLPAVLGVLLSFAPAIAAQTPCPEQKPGAPAAAVSEPTLKTFYLKNVTQQNDSNEIMVALRNVLDPRVKIYLVSSENVIVVAAGLDQLATAQRLIDELDRPRRSYRLTFTITDFDADKRLGSRRISMVLAAGQRTSLKQGTKVPLKTGSYDSGTAMEKMQVTYIDTGLNFDATATDLPNGVSLRSKVEQSSVVEEKSGIGPEDPLVRQAVLEGASSLVFGRPVMLGSLDIPESTKRMEISAVAEPLP